VLVHRTQVGLGDSVPLPRRQLVPLEGGVEIAPGTLAVFIQPAEVILRLGITQLGQRFPLAESAGVVLILVEFDTC
jgi:hypothetical protein